MKFAVLCYDFPHWKTQMGLFALYTNGYKPEVVIGAPWKQIDIKPSGRIVMKGMYLEEPWKICESFGFDYVSLPHEELEGEIGNDADYGIILGARILPKEIINSFSKGVINFHPGILPHNRGMDNVKWAVKNGIEQGVTAHFINERVDAGHIISKSPIPIYKDDTLQDVQFRLQNKEIDVMLETLKGLETLPANLEEVPKGKTFKTMTEKDEETLVRDFRLYKEVFGCT